MEEKFEGLQGEIDIETELEIYIPTQPYFERPIYQTINTLLDLGLTPYLVGVAGTGKTSYAYYYGYKHQLPTLVVNCDVGDLRSMLGNWILTTTQTNGMATITKFDFGILTKMLQVPSVVLFDEVNALDPEYLFFLHELINNRRFLIKDAPGLGTFQVNPKCRILLASNPSTYLGTKPLNIALLSRVVVVEVPIFSVEELEKIFPQLNNELKTFYVKINTAIIKDNLNTAFSIREVDQFLKVYNKTQDKKLAIEVAFLNKAIQSLEPEQIPDIKGLINLCFTDIHYEETTNKYAKL